MPRNFSCFVGCIKAAQARVVMSQANFGTLHMLSVSAPLVALVCSSRVFPVFAPSLCLGAEIPPLTSACFVEGFQLVFAAVGQ